MSEEYDLKGDWKEHEFYLATVPAFIRPVAKKWLAFRWAVIRPLIRHRFPTNKSIAHIFMVLFMALLAVLAYLTWSGGPGGSGNVASIPFLVAFFLGMRQSLQRAFFGLSYESGMTFHHWMGYAGLILSIYHGIHSMHVDDIWALGDWTGQYYSGWIITLAVGIMYLTSLSMVRRAFYFFFKQIHLLGVLVVIVGAVAHGAGPVLAGGFVWLIGYVLFFFIYELHFHPRQVKICMPTDDVVKVVFTEKNRRFIYQPGQYVFLCVPAVSRLHYHPFSFSSSPDEADTTIHLRAVGAWTRELAKVAKAGLRGPDELPVRTDGPLVSARIDGPVGHVNLDWESARYEHFLFFSGGLGVTPMLSICKALLHQHSRGRPLKKIMFIWSSRERTEPVASNLKEGEFGTEMAPIPAGVQNPTVNIAQRSASGPYVSGGLPMAFIPGLLTETFLKPMTEESVLETHLYLTQAELQYDQSPLPINTTRPNVRELLETMEAFAKGAPVAVLGCGPYPLMDTLKTTCRKIKNFDSHTEAFAF